MFSFSSCRLVYVSLILAAVLQWLPTVVESREKCHANMIVDMVFVVDITVSMSNDVDTLRTKVPELMNKVKSEYKGSRFGVVTFMAKSGWMWTQVISSSTICWVVVQGGDNHCPEIAVPLSSDSDKVVSALNRITCAGGSPDGTHEGFGAMLIAAANKDIGWKSRKSIAKLKNTQYIKLVVLLTDAGGALSDEQKWCPGTLDQLKPNPGDASYQCSTQNFPSTAQLKSYFKKHDVIPLFLVTSENIPAYNETLSRVSRKGAVLELASDSSNIVNLLDGYIKEIACSTTTTTTTTRTTTTTTTTTTTSYETTTFVTIPPTSPPSSPPYPLAIAGGLAALAVMGASVYAARKLMNSSAPLIEAQFAETEEDIETDDKNQAAAVTADNFA